MTQLSDSREFGSGAGWGRALAWEGRDGPRALAHCLPAFAMELVPHWKARLLDLIGMGRGVGLGLLFPVKLRDEKDLKS